MERIEAEEKTAREAEEKRKAEEQRIEEEKRREEERKVAEEKRIAEEKRVEEKRVAAEKRKQEEIAEMRRKKDLEEDAAAEAEEEQARALAFAKLVDENKKEKERAAKDLEKRRKSISKPLGHDVEVLVPMASPRRKAYKSKAIISDESDDEVVEQPREVNPRGTKRKRTIKMIAKGGPTEATIDNDTPLPPDNSQPRPPCSRCAHTGMQDLPPAKAKM
ncbi:hypothetical protein GGU11DRAFT_751504 [Lentinula aff. detonsa]|nr:hypothetical protein GGU11DRAFT_751504 [Lentinula aff. detonsa]